MKSRLVPISGSFTFTNKNNFYIWGYSTPFNHELKRYFRSLPPNWVLFPIKNGFNLHRNILISSTKLIGLELKENEIQK